MSLSWRESHLLLEAIEIAYAAHEPAAMFRSVSAALDRLVPMSSAAFISANRKSGEFSVDSSVVYNGPTAPMPLFVEHYGAIQPYIARTASTVKEHLNEVVRLTDLVPAARLTDTEYGCDFQPLVPTFYELDLWVGDAGDLVGGMGFHRGRRDRDFSDRERRIVARLAPHMGRALHRIALAQESLFADCAEFIVHGNERPRAANAEAFRVLRERPLDAIPIPRPSAQPALLWSCGGVYRIFALPIGSDGDGTKIILEPMPPEHALRARLAAFALTPRQQDVAILALRGLSNRGIAARLGISGHTVKDHLKDAFEQLKVQSRGEMRAKVLGLAAQWL